MATSLLALIDDIATVLDDLAVMTKVAAKKSAAVLGDDLAYVLLSLTLPALPIVHTSATPVTTVVGRWRRVCQRS